MRSEKEIEEKLTNLLYKYYNLHGSYIKKVTTTNRAILRRQIDILKWILEKNDFLKFESDENDKTNRRC